MRAQTAENLSRSWQARVDLFGDIEASLAEDPASAKGQALAARWLALVDSACGGDPEIKAGVIRAWADRLNWTATLRWQMEAVYGARSERFDKAAAFIDRALASVSL